MDPDTYYRDLKELAREQRARFKLETNSIGRREFRGIFSHYKVQLHLWPKPGLTGNPLKHMRGAYLNIDGDRHIMVDRSLPNDPYLFTLAHELKHHLCDQELAKAFCHDDNQDEVLEVGAEVFGAELLYPEREFVQDMFRFDVRKNACKQSDLVKIKHETGTSLSYTGLRKRAINFGYATTNMPNTGWRKIEISMYGLPYYLQARDQTN